MCKVEYRCSQNNLFALWCSFLSFNNYLLHTENMVPEHGSHFSFFSTFKKKSRLMRNILVGSFWMTLFLALFKLTHRPGSNLTGHFGLMSVCARHTTLTLTGTKWISIYLKLKKLKLRLLSSWGYVSLYYMVFKQTAHRQMCFFSNEKLSRGNCS